MRKRERNTKAEEGEADEEKVWSVQATCWMRRKLGLKHFRTV